MKVGGEGLFGFARRALGLLLLAMLAGCAGGGGVHGLVQDSPVKLGRPYTVAGRTYVPTDDPNYDQIGEASWYGNAEQGRHTASGRAPRTRRCPCPPMSR